MPNHPPHLGQVKGDAEVVVVEGVVLGRVKHLQQRRRRIASHCGEVGDLVDLIQHDDCVVAASTLQALPKI